MKKLFPYAITASAIALLAACGDDSSSSGVDESSSNSNTTSQTTVSKVSCSDVVALGPSWAAKINGVEYVLYPEGAVTDKKGNVIGTFDLATATATDATGNVIATNIDLNSLDICTASADTGEQPGTNATPENPKSSSSVNGGSATPASSSTAKPTSSTSAPVNYTSPVSLAKSASKTVPATIYAAWKPFHFVSMEDESTYYTEIASEFTEVFPAAFQPAGRVVWSTQSTGGYKLQCQETETTNSAMKFRGCTVSEGIGYGMLLTYFNGDDDAYLRLWNYSRGFREYFNLNLTPWITKSFMYNQIDNSSATDADLDIATSLILQHYRTGNNAYLQDALLIVNAIWEKEVNKSTLLLYSGDTETWTLADPTYNLSYFSPVALRLFAKVDPSHDWEKVLDNMYTYAMKVQDAGTGVFPDWSNEAGVAVNPPNGAAGNDKIGYTYHTFNKESVRIPWRIAWDYYWNQDERDLKILTKLNKFIVEKSGGDPSSLALAIQYSWDPAKEDYNKNTSIPIQWLSAWCATGLGNNEEWLNKCTEMVNASTVSNNGSSYFSDILLGLYSGLLNGLFARPF